MVIGIQVSSKWDKHYFYYSGITLVRPVVLNKKSRHLKLLVPADHRGEAIEDLLHHGKRALLEGRQVTAFIDNDDAYPVLDSRNHLFLEGTEAISVTRDPDQQCFLGFLIF